MTLIAAKNSFPSLRPLRLCAVLVFLLLAAKCPAVNFRSAASVGSMLNIYDYKQTCLLWLPLNGNTFDFSGNTNHGSWCGYATAPAVPTWTNDGACTIARSSNYSAILLNRPITLTSNFTIIVSGIELTSSSSPVVLINSMTADTGALYSDGFYVASNASAGYFRPEVVATAPSSYMFVCVGTNTATLNWFAIVRTTNAWTMYRDSLNATGIEPVPFSASYHTFSNVVTLRGVGNRYTAGGGSPVYGLGGIRVYNVALSTSNIVWAAQRSLLPSNPLDSTLKRTGNNIYVQTPTNFSWANTYPVVVYVHGAGDTGQSPLAPPGADVGKALFFASAVSNGWIVAQSDGGGTGLADGTGWGNPSNITAYTQLINYVSTTYPTNGRLVIVGASMGGTAALSIMATNTAITGGWFIYPVCDLISMVTNSYSSFTYSNDVMPAWPGSTSIASLSNNIAGYNPVWFPTTLWTNRHFAFTASASDTEVYETPNVFAMTNIIGQGSPAELTFYASSGQHGDGSNWTNVAAWLSFLGRN